MDVDIDFLLIVAGACVGFLVGLTGMGGGALMTPVLVLLFGIPPLAAVSSDLVVSLLMKPVGARVHAKHGTVNWTLVRWLITGSIPSAFAGVVILRMIGGDDAQGPIRMALGGALLLAATMTLLRPMLASRRAATHTHTFDIRPGPTLLLGVVGGVIVGMTSVGSGSLIIVGLLFLYPALSSKDVVGTDLVQAIPLVASASVGHLLLGDFHFDIATTLLIGALPGVYFGARACTLLDEQIVRRVVVAVLAASAVKLLNAPSELAFVTAIALLVLPPLLIRIAGQPKAAAAG